MLIRNPKLTRNGERRRLGFTLMEILIVVAIIVILASLGGVAVMNQYRESQVSTAKLKARSLGNAVKQYFLNNNQFPESLDQLLVKDESGRGPYVTSRDDIVDPWGQLYQY